MLMSGTWHLYRTGEKWWMGRDRMRVVIRTQDWQAVAFNVPICEFHTARSLERSSQVPRLGPDILSGEYTVEGGVERLRQHGVEHPEAEVAVVLLNQRVLAGLGNVYKSEVAFAAGVNPFRAMSTLTARELEVMAEVSQRYMKANILDGSGDGIITYSGNRRTTNNANREERLWGYGRQGLECRRCGATVMMRKQGEQVRSTYWCPACQPWVPAQGQTAEAPVGGDRGSRRRKVGC
jgi:endonuclease-8